jgi:hypothetical protein
VYGLQLDLFVRRVDAMPNGLALTRGAAHGCCELPRISQRRRRVQRLLGRLAPDQFVSGYPRRRSQRVPSQPSIVPVSWQTGHSHEIRDVSLKRARICPLHARRAGRRRQPTFVRSTVRGLRLVIHAAMAPKKVAKPAAARGSSPRSPESSTKFRRSITQISPMIATDPCIDVRSKP